MTVNVPALSMIAVFYAFVLGTGIWASIKSRKLESSSSGRLENLFLANRRVGFFIGVFTMAGQYYSVFLMNDSRTVPPVAVKIINDVLIYLRISFTC